MTAFMDSGHPWPIRTSDREHPPRPLLADMPERWKRQKQRHPEPRSQHPQRPPAYPESTNTPPPSKHTERPRPGNRSARWARTPTRCIRPGVNPLTAPKPPEGPGMPAPAHAVQPNPNVHDTETTGVREDEPHKKDSNRGK